MFSSNSRARARADSKDSKKSMRPKRLSKSLSAQKHQSVPGGFADDAEESDDDGPRYEVRTPGLSSIGRSKNSDDLSDNEDDLVLSAQRRQPAPHARQRSTSDVRHSISSMPTMPAADYSRLYSQPNTPHRTPLTATFQEGYVASPTSYASPYSHGPSTMPSFPVDISSHRMSMPVLPQQVPKNFQYANMPDYHFADPSNDLSRTSSNSHELHRPSLLHNVSEPVHHVASPSHLDSSIRSPGFKSPRASSMSHPMAYVEDADEDDEEPLPRTLSTSNQGRGLSVAQPHTQLRAPSPGLTPRMNRLSVSGNHPDLSGLGSAGVPPSSPLLEAYKGTYQSMSPMPSPMMLPARGDDADLDDLPSLSPSNSETAIVRRDDVVKPKKRVKLYDAEGDAEKIAKALKHSDPRREILLETLPELTHDQLLALREEYKKIVKVSGKGVNMSKHINMKFSTRDKFGQACYVTSLGRWESEAYWANFWYQEHTSNRELLIEALMGRTNADIREIKANFKAKKYDDDLSKCLEKELKPDKFRTAVLLALEGRRQEETETYSMDYRNRDVQALGAALNSRTGGESAIIEIIITRSDNHLREVLKTFERLYQVNFARAATDKSRNLVGEVIAHILNGVINRPQRDCLLLRHAINDLASKNHDVKYRYELLMSRLIRLHWDKLHLGRVKDEYRRRYQNEIEVDIKAATRADFRDFCIGLCEI